MSETTSDEFGSLPPKGGTHLLILQPTAFCNIDCNYCYLPRRNNKQRLSHETLANVIRNLSHDDVFAGNVEILWHAGEPMVVGIDYYERALAIIDECIPNGIAVRHAIQTNGTLIDRDWCAFFKANNFNVGLSIDGPRTYHDRQRRTRAGEGTFDRVMKSVQMLHNANLDFYIISVLTTQSLDHPSDFLDFAAEYKIGRICFNVEETEGIHVSPTLDDNDTPSRARYFFEHLINSAVRNEKGMPWVRELYQMIRSLRASATGPVYSDVNIPFRIITVDTEGFWSTFCPELMALKDPRFSDFRLGDLSAGPISRHLGTSKYHELHAQIKAGTARCRTSCEYFPVCGGGCPSNKISEHGTFDVSETRHCGIMIKSLADVVVGRLHDFFSSPSNLQH